MILLIRIQYHILISIPLQIKFKLRAMQNTNGISDRIEYIKLGPSVLGKNKKVKYYLVS
jgi:hypothetical protein